MAQNDIEDSDKKSSSPTIADAVSGVAPELAAVTVAVCVVAGMTLPTQTGMNVRMSMILGYPLRATLYSDLCATLTLALITAISAKWKLHEKDTVVGRTMRSLSVGSMTDHCNDQMASESRIEEAFPNDKLSLSEGLRNLYMEVIGGEWILIPGLALGVYFVSMAIYLTPHIGPSIFFICALLGQLLTSVILDKTGYLWNTPRSLLTVNYGGIVLLFIGVIVFNADSFGKLKVKLEVFIAYVALSISAGICIVIQATMNKRVRYHVGSPFRAALVSFAVGVCAGSLCNLGTLATNPNASVDGSQMRWYAWFGGCLSAMFVTATIVCPPIIGFSASFTCIVTGNLALSLTYDALGAFGFPKEKVSALKLIAVLLVISSALLVNWTNAMSQSLRRTLGAGIDLNRTQHKNDDKPDDDDFL